MSSHLITLLPETYLDELLEHETAWYAMRTCWWTTVEKHLYVIPGTGSKPGDAIQSNGLPCDPRRSPLMMAPAVEFIDAARANADHYGKHGLRAFLAAYHGCLVADNGLPTSFEKWPQYETAIDLYLGADAPEGGVRIMRADYTAGEWCDRYDALRPQKFFNGIACPSCGKELRDLDPETELASDPPQKQTICDHCHYVGFRLA